MEPLKVFGWAADHSGCGNYRIGLPMWCLNLMGNDALAFSVLNVDIPSNLDILVGQLIAGPDRSAQWRELAARPNRNFAMIYEIDDDIWNLIPSNPSYSFYNAEARTRAIENITIADAVTVTSEQLADVVSEHNPNVFVLPNCIDAAMTKHDRPRTADTTVGWAGGSSHGDDFRSVQNDLKSFFRRNPQVDTHFVGMNYGSAVGRPDTRFTGWVGNLVDYMRNLDFDIGIAPLAYNVFNRSKSDLKFLEYASLGMPVIASDFGPYSTTIEHGATGMLVKYPHEWAKFLRQLTQDEAMRTEIGDNARGWASTRTIQANIWRWDEVYRKVAGK